MMETYKGFIADLKGVRTGTLSIEDGRVSGIEETEVRDPGYVFMVNPVNGHTHCADYGLTVPAGMSLEDLVAPPDGLKHRYLRESPDEVIEGNMRRFSRDSASFGCPVFVDFREGGAHGCDMLRRTCGGATILGRPLSEDADPNELEEIASVAHGFGIPSISDVPVRSAERIADAARSLGKILALHVSERAREDIEAVLSLEPDFVVHMCEASDSDMRRCSDAGIPVVVCPRSNRYFGKVPPVRRMQDAGMEIAIGTDNGMICRPSIAEELSALFGVVRSQGGDPSPLWESPFVLGKILNSYRAMEETAKSDCISVVPIRGGDPLNPIGPGSGCWKRRR